MRRIQAAGWPFEGEPELTIHTRQAYLSMSTAFVLNSLFKIEKALMKLTGAQ